MPFLLLLAVAAQGLFFAGSLTAGEGMTAQRFMAARDERHAIGGQLFNAFLALSLRMLPLIGLGVVAMSLFWAEPLTKRLGAAPEGMMVLEEPVHAWAHLIRSCKLPVGLVGLLVAVEVAAFMSTLSSLINWGGSFLVNDFYKPLHPKATRRHEILVSRATTLIMFLFAGVIASLFVKGIVAWFLFINVAMVTFLLPLALFRFFWWRFNVWGELAAVGLGLPVAILVWFVSGLKDAGEITQGLSLLGVLGASFAILTTVSLLTPAESGETLRRFYERCRPPGLWRPVAGEAPGVRFGQQLVRGILGIVACTGLCVATNGIYAGEYILAAVSAAVSASVAAWLIRSIGTQTGR